MWVWIFLGIGLAGAVMTVLYGVWLWHKASDLFSELEMLGTRAEELADILGQISVDAASDRP